MLYLIKADTYTFDTIDALTEAVAKASINVADYLVVSGTAKRLVPRLDLQPVDAKPPVKRDKDADAALADRVLAAITPEPGEFPQVFTTAALAKLLDVPNEAISRAKAVLKNAGKLAVSKKGTLQVKAA